MIKSMTGYGRGIHQSEAYKITVEIRTLNSRYTEVHVHLPKEVPDLELEIKRHVRSLIMRGRVDVNCALETTREESFDINTAVIARYIEIFNKIKKDFRLGGELSIATVAQLPGVIVPKMDNQAIQGATFKEHLMSALNEAVGAVQKSRGEEGSVIQRDLVVRLGHIQTSLALIESEAGDFLEHYRNKLLQRMRSLTENLRLDEARLLQEAAYYAERSDVSEEILRLRSHINQTLDLIENGNEPGKRIDFLLQEMNREITTILSKAGGVRIAEDGVAIKAEIEKIREQIQNIE
jgi:uncharacterized protein (TIGR00255 family)